MERTPGLKLDRNTIGIITVLLFHAVGLTGFLIPAWHSLFLNLVPFHLLLMMLVLIAAYTGDRYKLLAFGSIIAIAGFFAEWVGIHTGYLFGEYQYGSTLGWKLANVPLIIGVNWFLLIYSCGVLLQKISIRNRWLRVIIGAAFMVSLDMLIEPVAIRFDYWEWVSATGAVTAIPWRNYTDWFLLSILFLAFFEYCSFTKQNKVAPVFFITQFVFFAALQMFAQV